MRMKGKWTRLGIISLGLYAAAFVVSAAVGGMAYFHFGNPQHTCACCHEMDQVHAAWSTSAHRTLHCRNCHGGSLTLDAHALAGHLNRVVQHFTGDLSKPIRMAEFDALGVNSACRDCHPQSYADWQSGGHSASYRRIFLDEQHNKAELLSDDCLRCHGMFFDGAVADLVTPLDKTGPWRLKEQAKADQPTIPCLACHQIHTPGCDEPPAKAHFYDNREQAYFPVSGLPVGQFSDKDRPVKISHDPRQRLCAQCHAPSAAQAHRLGSSDDRTPLGVHEGLGCLDCHQAHNNSANASCAACHPAASHCGLDVEKMDTSYFSKSSRHNVHTVACGDCHADGRPTPKLQTEDGKATR